MEVALKCIPLYKLLPRRFSPASSLVQCTVLETTWMFGAPPCSGSVAPFHPIAVNMTLESFTELQLAPWEGRC